jgi:hypothetical protein
MCGESHVVVVLCNFLWLRQMLVYIIKIGDYHFQCLQIPVVHPFVAAGWYEFDESSDTCVIR